MPGRVQVAPRSEVQNPFGGTIVLDERRSTGALFLIRRQTMDVKSAVESFLTVVCSPTCDQGDRIRRLKVCLDELALLANTTQYIADEADYPNPPRANPASWDKVEKLFPSLGFYNVALGIPERRSKTLGVNAIEDIVDIAGDLAEVLWRMENTSTDDALFHFQLTFQSHWGVHLRCLQLYLHDL